MPIAFIITTPAAELAVAWARQLPATPQAFDLEEALAGELQRPGARVWIMDMCAGKTLPRAHPDTVVIAVGEPSSLPFEEARSDPRVSFCVSYEESRKNLFQIARVAAELAEKRTVVTILSTRQQRPAAVSAPPLPDWAQRNGLNELEFVEAALEHLDDLPFILDVFKRGFRARLRAAKVAVFLKEQRRFRATTEGWECMGTDPLVLWLKEHAAIVDCQSLNLIEPPIMEAVLRQKMGEWNARLIVPIEVQGALEGWVAFGPRADARCYSQQDREDSLMLVSLLSRVLAQHKILSSALAAQNDVRLLNRHGPKLRIVGADGASIESLPVEVREVLGFVRRDNKRVDREYGSLRVSAGPLPEKAGFWVIWDENGASAQSVERKLENERYRILHDIGLVLSHELANALLSVSVYFQHVSANPAEASSEAMQPMRAQAERDVARLKEIPHILEQLYDMAKARPAQVDMKRLVQAVAKEIGGTAEVTESRASIWGHEEHLHNALLWICQEIILARDTAVVNDAKIKLTLQERHREGAAPICLVTIAQPGLRLDQIKVGEEQTVEEYPTTPVYLAREIIRYHYGTVHIGQGLDGPEVHIAVKSRGGSESGLENGRSGKTGERAEGTSVGNLAQRVALRENGENAVRSTEN